jgi:hypothetical protein
MKGSHLVNPVKFLKRAAYLTMMQLHIRHPRDINACKEGQKAARFSYLNLNKKSQDQFSFDKKNTLQLPWRFLKGEIP